MAFDITVKHPLYEDNIDAWTQMRDCFEGEDTVKEAGVRYLPMKTGIESLKNKKLRDKVYGAYRMRAEFPELLAPTVRGSVGLAHDQSATITLPTSMEYLLERATQDGLTLEALHRRITREVLTTGRFGLLPAVAADNRFYLAGYTTETIINWDVVDGALRYVVLDESRTVRDVTTNQWEDREIYLECFVSETGTYQARRWTKTSSAWAQEELEEARTPSRQAIPEVPFVFIDSMDLTAEPDDIPLYGLAKLALRIYRLDADYMQSLHMTSEPTPVVTGFSDPKKAIDNGEVPTTIGAARVWILPKDATAEFLEFEGKGISAQQKAIADSLERAVAFGAQILSEQSRQPESGDSRRLRLQGQYATLKDVAMTSAAGLERALRNIALWAGENPDEVTVKPFLDFVDHSMSSDDLKAMVAGWQAGAYSKRTLFDNLQRADLVPQDRTFEDEEEMISDEAGGLGGGGGGTEPGETGGGA